LRRKTNDSSTSFPDEDVDLLFASAEDEYGTYSRSVQLQAVVVMRIDELWTASMTQVTYQQNETRENLSDIAKNLEKKLELAKAKLDELISKGSSPAVIIAAARRVPNRNRELPRS
jgi:hypothetical protein